MIIQVNHTHQESAFDLIEKARKNMQSQGIMQWTEAYPSLNDVLEDIQRRQLFGYFQGNLLTGIITLNEHQDNEYKNIDWLYEGNIGVVHRLTVHPDFQGQGIAKKLMEYAVEHFQQAKFDSIRLDAFSENPAALALYDGLGYERRGEVFFPMRNRPFWCFEKKIS